MAGVSLNYAGLVGRIANVLLGKKVRYAVCPSAAGGSTLAGIGTPGVQLTTGAGAWGVLADIAAAKLITKNFWICALMFRAAGAAQVFEIEVEDSAKNTLFQCFFDPTAVTVNLGSIPVPYPISMTANAEVQAKAGGAAAKTIYVGMLYATLL